MRVELPDGRIIEDVPDGTTKEQLAQKLKANGMEVPKEWMPAQPKRQTPMEMIKERAQEFGRQIGLTARAGIEGAVSLPAAILDTPVTVARAFGSNALGSNTSEAVHNNLTALGFPEPKNTQERIVQDIARGMAGAGGVTKLSQLGGLATGAGAMNNVISGGIAGGASGGAREMGAPPIVQSLAGLASMARPGLGLKPPPTSIRAPEQAVLLKTWEEANAAGYKFAPTHIDSSGTRKVAESVGGKAAVDQEMAIHNQVLTNKLSKKGAGLTLDQDLTEANLAQARDVMAEPYRQIAAISPAADRALRTWKDANAKAKRAWNEFQITKTEDSYQKYKLQERRSDVAQTRMETQAIRTGNYQLVKELQEARVKIAQNFDVDKALNIGSGNVRADVLGRMLNARGEAGLTGPLGIIAKTQQAFPKYLREASKVPTPGVGKLEALASIGLGAGAYEAGLGVNGAAAAMALPMTSAVARKFAMSSLLQKPKAEMGIPLSAVQSFLAQRSEGQ